MTTIENFFEAIENNNESEVKEILTYNPEFINAYQFSDSQVTPIFRACNRGHENIVILLINFGADINLSKDSNTMIEALYTLSYNTVKLMIEHGGNIHQKNIHGHTAFYLVHTNSNFNYLKDLFSE